MKITNIHNMPDMLVRAVEREYVYRDKRYSITSLLEPPRIIALKRRYNEKIEQDITDCIFMLLGTKTHFELENIELKEKRRWLEQLPKEKIYTTDEFIELITSKDSEVRDYESIRNLNERLLDVYTLEERKYILSKLLFNDSFAELFKVVIDVNYKITGKYSELNEIIDKNSRNNNINQLLTKRILITDMLLEENRKELSKILLLNTKIIEESNIENKQKIITQMLQWSYDLYNDIMRDIEIRGFSDSLKEIINKIFAGKTFGKIRFRNKQ